MSSDDPFDFDAPQERPARRSTSSSGRPSQPRSDAPGRRPAVRATSRARANGAAKPLPPSEGRTSGAPGRTNAQRRPARQGERPPSYSPGSAGADEGGPRTRQLPTDGGGPARSVSARTPADRSGTRPPDAPPTKTKPAGKPRKRRRGRRVAAVLVLLLVLALAWPIGLLIWANGKINHVEALSGGLQTAGTTYLLAGSDSRSDGALVGDTTEGARTDTIMLLTVPPSGNTSLISLPRDTYVEIPGYEPNKLNAAYSFGGAPLLVETVEGLTGIQIDHYVEIGMGGVEGLVDAVGGVELCLDYDVSDEDSGLEWEAGCHVVDGETALAFARMRKSDPLGDIGRTQRQQQVIQAVTSAIAQPSLVFKPGEQVRLIDAGLAALTVSEGTNILDMGRLALAFREATGENGVRGNPPISNLDYRPGGVGSAVQLDPETVDAFFAAVADGSVTNEDTADIG